MRWRFWQTRRRPRIIFIHIGRTGGTTLRLDLLWQVYPLHESFCIDDPTPRCRYGSAAQLAALPQSTREEITLLLGHMPFGLAELFPRPHEWHYITFLRHPLARTVSDYYYARNTPANPAHPLAQSLSLAEYVAAGYGHSHNCMTRVLSGALYGKGYASEQQMLAQALRNAESCSFIGFTEHYAESVARLCRRFHWPQPALRVHNRLTPPQVQLSRHEEDTILHHNQLDLVLYQQFLDRFLQAAAQRPSPEAILPGCP